MWDKANRYASDVWDNVTDDIGNEVMAGVGGRTIKAVHELPKDVLSDVVDSVVPGDLDRLGKNKTRATLHAAGKHKQAEAAKMTGKIINAGREYLVDEGLERAGKKILEYGTRKAALGATLGPAAAPVFAVDTIKDIASISSVASEAITGKNLEQHALASARAMNKGRTIGSVLVDGDWDTEMPRRWDMAVKSFNPMKGDFGVSELLDGV